MDRTRKDYRTPFRILLILFSISFTANLFMLGLHLKERKEAPAPAPRLKESRQVEEGKKVEMARKEEAPGGAAATLPLPFTYVKKNEHILLCEKRSKTLTLYQSIGGAFSLVKRYACIVGSNNVDKKEVGDLATPEGIYFLISFMTGGNLPEKYGYGAFSLNYPNFLDQREGKKGKGIWLHGSPAHLERPPFSEGCVVLKDEDLRELAAHIRIGDTPIAIVDSVQYQPPEEHRGRLQSMTHFVRDWKAAWESRNTEKYIGFYSSDFISGDGKNYQKFKEYKHRINQTKRFIQLQLEPKSYLLSQKHGGCLAVLRLNQDYRSDNFKSFSRKILYVREKQGKWEIIGEFTL
jgi:murein L,D-transpeptidase YafK